MKRIILFGFIFLICKTVMPQFVAMPLNFPWDTSAYLTYWTSIVDENTVWVGTAHQKSGGYAPYSKAIKTSDGGDTWQFFDIPVMGQPWIQHLSAWDSSICYYLFTDGFAYGGAVWKTSDGGATWTKKTTTQFTGGWGDVVHAFSADTVVSIGDPTNGYLEVQFSPDGGDTWTRIPAADVPAALTGETGLSGDYCAVGNSIWFPTSKGRCFYSHDKGLHWGVAAVIDSYIRVSFSSEQSGIAIIPGSATHIYATSDGGATWNKKVPSVTIPLGSVCRVPGISNGYIATTYDTTLTTVFFSDNGLTSCTVIESGILNASFPNFKSPTIGWLGGGYRPINNIHKFIGTLTSVAEKTPVRGNLLISPNPATGSIIISLPYSTGSGNQTGANNTVTISTLTGAEIMRTSIDGVSTRMDITTLLPGIYLVKVTTAEGVFVGKVVRD